MAILTAISIFFFPSFHDFQRFFFLFDIFTIISQLYVALLNILIGKGIIAEILAGGVSIVGDFLFNTHNYIF